MNILTNQDATVILTALLSRGTLATDELMSYLSAAAKAIVAADKILSGQPEEPAKVTANCAGVADDSDDVTSLVSDELAFWGSSFLRVLPSSMESTTWTIAGRPVTTGDAKVQLAAQWADSAVAERRRRSFVVAA